MSAAAAATILAADSSTTNALSSSRGGQLRPGSLPPPISHTRCNVNHERDNCRGRFEVETVVAVTHHQPSYSQEPKARSGPLLPVDRVPLAGPVLAHGLPSSLHRNHYHLRASLSYPAAMSDSLHSMPFLSTMSTHDRHVQSWLKAQQALGARHGGQAIAKDSLAHHLRASLSVQKPEAAPGTARDQEPRHDHLRRAHGPLPHKCLAASPHLMDNPNTPPATPANACSDLDHAQYAPPPDNAVAAASHSPGIIPLPSPPPAATEPTDDLLALKRASLSAFGMPASYQSSNLCPVPSASITGDSNGDGDDSNNNDINHNDITNSGNDNNRDNRENSDDPSPGDLLFAQPSTSLPLSQHLGAAPHHGWNRLKRRLSPIHTVDDLRPAAQKLREPSADISTAGDSLICSLLEPSNIGLKVSASAIDKDQADHKDGVASDTDSCTLASQNTSPPPRTLVRHVGTYQLQSSLEDSATDFPNGTDDDDDDDNETATVGAAAPSQDVSGTRPPLPDGKQIAPVTTNVLTTADESSLQHLLYPSISTCEARLVLENRFLIDQHRHLLRDLTHIRASSQALRQVVQAKDEHLEMVIERNQQLVRRIQMLEAALAWERKLREERERRDHLLMSAIGKNCNLDSSNRKRSVSFNPPFRANCSDTELLPKCGHGSMLPSLNTLEKAVLAQLRVHLDAQQQLSLRFPYGTSSLTALGANGDLSTAATILSASASNLSMATSETSHRRCPYMPRRASPPPAPSSDFGGQDTLESTDIPCPPRGGAHDNIAKTTAVSTNAAPLQVREQPLPVSYADRLSNSTGTAAAPEPECAPKVAADHEPRDAMSPCSFHSTFSQATASSHKGSRSASHSTELYPRSTSSNKSTISSLLSPSNNGHGSAGRSGSSAEERPSDISTKASPSAGSSGAAPTKKQHSAPEKHKRRRSHRFAELFGLLPALRALRPTSLREGGAEISDSHGSDNSAGTIPNANKTNGGWDDSSEGRNGSTNGEGRVSSKRQSRFLKSISWAMPGSGMGQAKGAASSTTNGQTSAALGGACNETGKVEYPATADPVPGDSRRPPLASPHVVAPTQTQPSVQQVPSDRHQRGPQSAQPQRKSAFRPVQRQPSSAGGVRQPALAMTASPREISPSNSSETPNKRRSIDISLLVSMPPFAYKSPTSLLNEHLDDDDDDDYALTDSKLLAERRARHREATLASLQQVPRSRPQRQPRYNGDSGSELASSRGNNGPRGVSFCMPESRQPSPDQAHPSLPKMSISSSTTQSVDSIDPARLITLINRRGSHGVLEIPSPGRPRRRDSLQKLAKRYSDSAVYAKSLRKRDSISRLFQGGGSFSAWLERHKLWSRAQGSTSKPRDPADRKRKSRHASLFRRLSSSLVRRGSDSTPGANRGAPKGEGNHNARASNSSECSASQQQGKRSSQTKSWHTSNISRGEDERGGSQATERGKVSDAHFGSGVGRWSCINANLSSSDMSNGSEDGRSRRSMLNGSSPSRLQLAAAGDRVTLRPDKPSAVLDQGSAMRSQFKTFIHLGLSDEAPTSNIEGTESDILGLLSLASSQALAPSSGSNTLSPYDEVWNDGVICGSSIHMKSDSALSHEPIQEENDEIENTPVLTVAEEIAPGRGDLKQQG